MGQVTVAQNALVAISAGLREVTAALAGVVPGARYVAFCDSYRVPSNAPSATPGRPSGYAILDCVCNTAGQITVTVSAPLLALGSSYSMTVSVVRINAS